MADLITMRENRLQCISALTRGETNLSKFFSEDFYCDYFDPKIYNAVKCKCCIWDTAIFGNPKVLCRPLNSTRKSTIDSDLYPGMTFIVQDCEKWNSITSTANTLFHWLNEFLFDRSGNAINYVVHRHNNCGRTGRMLISTYDAIPLPTWLESNSDPYLIYCLIRQWAFLLHLWKPFSLSIPRLKLNSFAVIPSQRVLTNSGRVYEMPISLMYVDASNTSFKFNEYRDNTDLFDAFVDLLPNIDLKIPVDSNYFDFCFT